MNIRDIAVHVDHREQCRPGLEVAAALAARLSAHLSGIYVDSVPMASELVAMSAAPALLDTLAAEEQQRTDQARARFEQVVKAAGVRSGFAHASGPMFPALSRHARCSDLLVLTQEGNGETGPVLGGFADYAVMDCGRPVLVVPFIGAPAPVDGTALVAWDGSREAARAVNDALPLLALAQEVQVVMILPRGRAVADSALSGADVCEHLARHDLKAEAKEIPGTDVDSGNVLLSHAADLNANLIVMGAYGHSRLREMVLGGVTRQMLLHMTVPVLMSH